MAYALACIEREEQLSARRAYALLSSHSGSDGSSACSSGASVGDGTAAMAGTLGTLATFAWLPCCVIC